MTTPQRARRPAKSATIARSSPGPCFCGLPAGSRGFLVCAATCEAPRANMSLKRARAVNCCAAGPPSVCLFKNSAQEKGKGSQVRFVRGWCPRSAACSPGAAPEQRWPRSIYSCACSLAGDRAPCQFCGRRGRMCGREETQKSRGGC
jgi:hypothetical protein